jgi:MoaA/NifB/PqqE/SkfB family radical SAM enzyme
MLKLEDIRHLHIEASSLCNARCPLCPRNVFGYPHNLGYTETSLSLDLIKRSLSPQFLSQITSILLNGNFGDFTSNLEILPILRYFREHSSMSMLISTNGSARNREFWEDLAKLGNIEIEFCLDGLEDTHHLYRQDTDWNKIIQNAQWFMAAGGKATWKMIKFKHNEHQREACEKLSKELGFYKFLFNDHGRDQGPAFNRDGSLSHVIGDYDGFKNAQEVIDWLNTDSSYRPPQRELYDYVDCEAKRVDSIYIAADGKVYPCCWLGFSPETYHKSWVGKLNQQITKLVKNNNLHKSSLEECIRWFVGVEKSWAIDSYKEGRLMQCDISCGRCKK